MSTEPAARRAPRWRRRTPAAVLVAAVLAAAHWAPGLLAAEDAGPPAASRPKIGLSQLGLERWGPESGLAGSWVRGIVEGPDGFLWIATSGGLSRFDGASFVSFTAANTAELPTSSITALAAGGEGRIWIGLESELFAREPPLADARHQISSPPVST